MARSLVRGYGFRKESWVRGGSGEGGAGWVLDTHIKLVLFFRTHSNLE